MGRTLESSVNFPRSSESTSINMPSVDQKPELGIPDLSSAKKNEYVITLEFEIANMPCSN